MVALPEGEREVFAVERLRGNRLAVERGLKDLLGDDVRVRDAGDGTEPNRRRGDERLVRGVQRGTVETSAGQVDQGLIRGDTELTAAEIRLVTGDVGTEHAAHP
jgi:hypothetical protein